jgi:hypothetical protein
MTVMTRTRFDVVPLSKHIGAEIRGLDLRGWAFAEPVAASSRSHATAPSGCVGAAGPVSSIAAQFSAGVFRCLQELKDAIPLHRRYQCKPKALHLDKRS